MHKRIVIAVPLFFIAFGLLYFMSNDTVDRTLVNINTPMPTNTTNLTHSIPQANTSRDAVSNINIESEKHIESKLAKNCLDELNVVEKKLNQYDFSVTFQKKTSALLNDCIYEIDMELALTEKGIVRTAETISCLNNIYAIRDDLLMLGVDAQRFSELPNITDSDRVIISEAFLKIYNNITDKAFSAISNRTDVCSR